jgi:hypothetical protein
MIKTMIPWSFRRSLLFIPILLASEKVFSQSQSLPVIIPPTPNVASLAKYGDTPIGLYTGQPNINFPLYEIKYNDFSMPISLSYNYSGLKVEEYPGWVGTGWTLRATGVITRQTRNLPDERLNGYNGQNKRGLQVVSFINSGAKISDPTFKTFLTGVKDGLIDTEPDMFVFSLPGISGKFFFDESQCNSNEKEGNLFIKQATVVPYQKIIIKGYFDYIAKYSTIQGIIKKFEITDEKGVKYLFEDMEKAESIREDIDNGSAALEDYGNAWYLSTITTPFSNTIIFKYKYRILDNPPTVYEQKLIPEDFSTNVSYHASSTTEAILDKIYFRNGLIEFIESDLPRLDWNSGTWQYSKSKGMAADEILLRQPKSLSKIKVTVAGNVIKEIGFRYGYFGNNARLWLDSFEERNGAQSIPRYQFIYESGLFPTIGDHNSLFNQDHWGYYTGTNFQTLLTPFFGSIDGSFGLQSISLAGNLRLPVPQVAKSGLLAKIIYPSGGTTSFEYEPNDFYSSANPNFVPPKGDYVALGSAAAKTRCSVATGTCSVGEAEERKDIKLETVTFGKIEFSVDVANCGEGAATVRLLKKKSQEAVFWYDLSQNGSGVKQASQLAGAPTGTVFMLQPGEYELVANATVESTCQVPLTRPAKASIDFLAFVADNSGGNYVAGGLRVKKTTDCDTDISSGCVTKHFTYEDVTDPTKSSGVLINYPLYFHTITTLAVIPCPAVNCGGLRQGLGAVLSANSIVPIAGSQGGVIGYKYVTERRDNDESRGGKTDYKFSSAEEYPDEVFYTYPTPLRIDNDWKRGAEVHRKEFATTSSTKALKRERQSAFIPYEIYNRKIGLKTGPNVIPLEFNYTMQIQDYDYKPYSLTSGRMSLSEETTSNIANDLVNSIRTKYFYENPSHWQVTKIQTFINNGDDLVTILKYPDDVNNISSLSAQETEGIRSTPYRTTVIEKEQFRNSIKLSTERNLYNASKLAKFQASVSGNPLQDKVKINGYDTQGNILNYITEQGENVSYLYGYQGYYPIAEVQNANSEDIFHTSFEDEGQTYVDSENKKIVKTGDKVLLGGSYIFPNSFLPPNEAGLLMSFWSWLPSTGWEFKEVPFLRTINTVGNALDEVRVYPKGAMMTTFTYRPGVGMTTKTDTNNNTSYYEFDVLGRLQRVKDQDGNVVKNYEYGYKTNR